MELVGSARILSDEVGGVLSEFDASPGEPLAFSDRSAEARHGCRGGPLKRPAVSLDFRCCGSSASPVFTLNVVERQTSLN